MACCAGPRRARVGSGSRPSTSPRARVWTCSCASLPTCQPAHLPACPPAKELCLACSRHRYIPVAVAGASSRQVAPAARVLADPAAATTRSAAGRGFVAHDPAAWRPATGRERSIRPLRRQGTPGGDGQPRRPVPTLQLHPSLRAPRVRGVKRGAGGGCGLEQGVLAAYFVRALAAALASLPPRPRPSDSPRLPPRAPGHTQRPQARAAAARVRTPLARHPARPPEPAQQPAWVPHRATQPHKPRQARRGWRRTSGRDFGDPPLAAAPHRPLSHPPPARRKASARAGWAANGSARGAAEAGAGLGADPAAGGGRR